MSLCRGRGHLAVCDGLTGRYVARGLAIMRDEKKRQPLWRVSERAITDVSKLDDPSGSKKLSVLAVYPSLESVRKTLSSL